jgi:O-acetylhomoserine/O-acetylserine sulfhydrylase-like pyridoxal-dependent enzyme
MRSLAIHPVSATCSLMKEEGGIAVGVTQDLIRIRAGTDHIGELFFFIFLHKRS